MARIRRKAANGLRMLRAIATNQVAGLWPRMYMRLAGQTGRGGGQASAAETAEYFLHCYRELDSRLPKVDESTGHPVSGQDVLEYGPGSIPGLAMLMLAHGARSVTCVDRFPLLQDNMASLDTLTALADRLDQQASQRLRELTARLDGNGIPGCLTVVLHARGLSCLNASCDLVVSRAVLEETNDLPAISSDMAAALRPGGIAVHQVDLGGYGLCRDHPLDFLVPSPFLWQLMFSNKCVPNRLRLGKYLEYAEQSGLRVLRVERDRVLPLDQVEAIRPRLWRDFRTLPAPDLACLSCWIVLEKPSPSARDAANP